MCRSTRDEMISVCPYPPGHKGRLGLDFWLHVLSNLQEIVTLVGKRNTCKTDLHISRMIIKSNMNNESAWPVAFTATTPDTRSDSTILYCLFLTIYIYIAVKQACRVLTGDPPPFMQHMYCKCVYISFLTNARILVGFAAEQNYSVCAVQFFLSGPQNEPWLVNRRTMKKTWGRKVALKGIYQN